MQLSRELAAVTSSLPPDSIDFRWLKQAYDEHAHLKTHDRELVPIIEDTIVYAGETTSRGTGKAPFPFLYFWPNSLWPIYSLSFFGWNGQKTWKALVLQDSQELKLLKNSKVRFILFNRSRCVSAIEIDFPTVPLRLWALIKNAPQRSPFIGAAAEAKAYAICNSGQGMPKGSQGLLARGWATRINEQAQRALDYYRDHGRQIVEERPLLKETVFAEVLGDSEEPLAALYRYFQEAFWQRHENPFTIFREIEEMDELGAVYHYELSGLLARMAWFSSVGTANGLQIPSIGMDGAVQHTEIRVQQLREKCHGFWDRLSFEFPILYREVLGGDNCPMDLPTFLKESPIYEGSLDEGEQLYDDLLAEACTLQQWTIPFGAYVSLHAGSVEAVRLHQVGSEVACLLTNAAGEYLTIWINPADGSCKFEIDWCTYGLNVGKILESGVHNSTLKSRDEDDRLQEVSARLLLGIRILLAAIIRDFWVVEVREGVFGASRVTRKGPGLGSDKKKDRVIYLPRIKYVCDAKKFSNSLDHSTRRPHFVSGHLRKALKASKIQLVHAKRYGIVVPKGFTFVKPHRRGDEAQEKTYRSRSALACLQALDSSSPEDRPDDWFGFEVRVKQWLAQNGYQVEHISANTRADGGVDIQASKGDEYLLVQCKYWHRQKIKPNIIREMIGTLHSFPEGARGVIVTSSMLTGGAKELAIQNQIQFIEMVNFKIPLQHPIQS